jgi:surface antigen
VNRSVGAVLRHSPGAGVLTAIGLATIAPTVPITTASATAPAADRAPAIFGEPPPPGHLHLVHDPGEMAVVAVQAKAPAPAVQPRYSAPQAPASTWTPTALVARPAAGSGNRFYYGYCTWWVAHKRFIPWRGNAWEWWGEARGYGYAEGYAPRVGSIMVMGISGTSPSGHVAYVEAVYANGSFLVSEMNWWGVPGGGWGRVDYRTVTSRSGILGFIY